MSLSDKKIHLDVDDAYYGEDVKEAVQRLKEVLKKKTISDFTMENTDEWVNKIFGEELSK